MPADLETAEIPLTQGLVALVDFSDLEELSKYKWFAVRQRIGFVAGTKINYRMVYMHRLLLDTDAPTVDHINGNGLDNRRLNLRPATRAQNSQNRGKHQTIHHSRFKGVTLHRGKWVAYIYLNGKRKHLGYFSSQEEAAKAYDKSALENFGEFARTNF